MSTATAPQLIGSSWDTAAGPDTTAPHHLAEWVNGSAVDPLLAAANVQTLQGSAVLEALAGDRLEQLGGEAGQYATGAVSRLLAPLEPLAAAGGWWCSGLDPLADWAPMGWGCFKPDRPRLDPTRGRPRKYEHPTGTPARLFWLAIPRPIAQRVADRFGLALPPEVAADATGAAGAFWRWWASTPGLPLLLTEGAKKAAALLSIGLPAVGAPGIWNPAPRNLETGRAQLLPELAAVPLQGRPCSVLYDWSDSPTGRRDVARAARRVGRLLEKAGADAVRVGCCPGPAKGADDHLTAGGTWEQLAAALLPLVTEPALPRLRSASMRAAAGQALSDATPSDATRGRRLIATNGGMGSGKTMWGRDAVAPYLAAGVPVVGPTHRTALGESQAEALGIPWAPMPGTDERLQGLGLCWDSLRPSSALQIRPADLLGADGLGPVVMLDEAAQGVEHVLFGTGTAVAQHRPETMATAAELLRSARLILAMDAQLSEPVLQLLEALTGERAYLIGSDHRPMAGRPAVVPQGLTARTAAEHGRARVLELAKQRRGAFVITTAQQEHAKGSARNLARLVRKHWPEARVLVIDSEAPDEAEQLGSDPNGTAAAHDFIICSPSITSGLSIDAPGLFAEVVVIGAGGRLPCEHLAQAAARVRDPACPVTVYAPAAAPQLRIGSGDTNPAGLLAHLAACESRLLADLVGAAGWDAAARNESPWLRCWLELAAHRNRQAGAYSITVAALLEAEGWAVATTAEAPPAAMVAEAAADLTAIAEAATTAADVALIDADPITPAEVAELERKRRPTPAERAALQRYRIAQRWGLGADPPTPELLEADRDGLPSRLRFGWVLQSIEGRQLAAQHDRKRAAQLAPNGRGWAPDLVRELLGHRIAAADALKLPALLEKVGQWLSPADLDAWDLKQQEAQGVETLEQEAQRRAKNQRRAQRCQLLKVLGLSPGKRPSGTLRPLLRLTGHRLEAKRERCGEGARRWAYRVVAEPLPAGACPQRLEAAWRDRLACPTA